MLWGLVYFFFYFYVLLLISVILYAIPASKDILNYHKFKNLSRFSYVTGFDSYHILIVPLFLLYFINFVWSGPFITSWFGCIIFSGFQAKISYFIFFFFFLILTVYTSSFYFSSNEIWDYFAVCFNFLIWMLFLFFSNTIFTVIFFIEILSNLIFLLLITSVFSTTYFYNNLNLNLHSYFAPSTPLLYIQTLLYFFWISLISSINLFFFLILFYIKFLSFDWFLIEFIFYYILSLNDLKELFFLVFIWLNLLFCIFLKCGLVPFYFWKPVFFKGIPLHTLFFYILFFYFFIFLFFIYFFLIYVNEIFYFFIYVNIFLLVFGFLFLFFILVEAFYLKTFLALSSILNTLFVFLAISGTTLTDLIFSL